MSVDNNITTLRLDGELTIYRAAELKALLLDALAHSPTLALDLSAVSELDSAGVQLLMLARRSALERHGGLLLTGHSAAVLDVFKLLGLDPHFASTPVPLSPFESSYEH